MDSDWLSSGVRRHIGEKVHFTDVTWVKCWLWIVKGYLVYGGGPVYSGAAVLGKAFVE